jgi:hypothetical protein
LPAVQSRSQNVKKIVNALVAAAGSRARSIIRKQAEAGKPFQENFRSNAGGWN